MAGEGEDVCLDFSWRAKISFLIMNSDNMDDLLRRRIQQKNLTMAGTLVKTQ